MSGNVRPPYRPGTLNAMPSPVNHMEISGATVAWAWIGHASPAPLVFLHGLGDSSIMTFQPIATHPALGGRPALLLDLPGFGYGRAPGDWPATMDDHSAMVVSLLRELGIQDATIVGHSMGGSLALLVATGLQDRIARLVLAEPLLDREHSALGKAIAKRPEAGFIERGFDMLLLATQRQANRGDAAARGFLAPLRRANPTTLHRSAVSLLADRTPSFLEILGQLPMPRTVLIGERTDVDRSIIPSGVNVVTIPDAGHSMMSENPDGFARAISDALGESHEGDGRASVH